MAVFESDTKLNVSVERLFEFMIQPKHLKQIAPPEMGLRFLEAPEIFQLGDTFKFAVQTMGQLQTITHRISVFETPHLYVEELIEGPLPRWIHTHSFMPLSGEQTLVKDVIEFDPPGGLIGLLMTESRILDHLEDGFHHRHQQLHKLFT
jgi:ligand-binding SRPBCC domain-containing protein